MSSDVLTRKGNLVWIVGLAGAAVGYLIGANATGQSAIASPDEDKASQMLKQKELVPIQIQPPAVALTHGGVALVGAADDRYYIVKEDGTTVEVVANYREADRRNDLFWR